MRHSIKLPTGPCKLICTHPGGWIVETSNFVEVPFFESVEQFRARIAREEAENSDRPQD